MNSTNKEKETSVRDRLNEAIWSDPARSQRLRPRALPRSGPTRRNLLIMARDRIDELKKKNAKLEELVEDLERKVENLEMDIFDNGPY